MNINFHIRENIDPDEYAALKEVCDENNDCFIISSRMDIEKNCLLVPRYAIHPYPGEYYADASKRTKNIINSLDQYRFSSNIGIWQETVLSDMIKIDKRPYSSLDEGSYVIKGANLSKKFNWQTHMFAKTKADVPVIVNRLLDIDEVSGYGLFVRPFIKLRKLCDGLNGLPVSNEWRFFAYKGKIFYETFYWASFQEAIPYYIPPIEAYNCAQSIINQVGNKSNFFSVDVGEKEEGGWIGIEINDGQQSGLCCAKAKTFYRNLIKEIRANEN